VSEALEIVVSALAAEQIRAAAEWWRLNRPKAPDAIREDIDRASSLIAIQPDLGAARERLVPMRIEQKRISRRESTHLNVAGSSCCHLGVSRAHHAELCLDDEDTRKITAARSRCPQRQGSPRGCIEHRLAGAGTFTQKKWAAKSMFLFARRPSNEIRKIQEMWRFFCD